MRLHVVVWLMAAGLGGCSSISRDLAFDGAGEGAFAIVAADGMVVNGSESYTFVFQKLDPEKDSAESRRLQVTTR